MLRQARVDAGNGSHGALARKLNVSRPVVTKAENPAHPVPSDPILAAWAGATGAPLDVLTDLAQRAKSGTPDWFMPYRQAEAGAHTLRCWAPIVIPGLLQCEPYARAILAVEFSGGRLDELVAARLERQDVLQRAYVTAVIDHHVLHRLIGSPVIMAEQCACLATMANSDGISLHVLPEGTNMGTWGAFDIATQDHTTTVCLTALEDVTSTTTDLTVKAMRAFERMLGAAIPRPESLDLIRTAEERWKAQI
jgi:hypothetical protein